MSRRRRFRAALLAAGLGLPWACGSPSGPTPLPSPSAPPGPVHDVGVVLFFDEDGDAGADRAEEVRLPGVEVDVGGRTAVTDRTGRALVAGVPEGERQALVRSDALPPFFVAPPPVAIRVPAPSDALLGVRLPIGVNRRNVYMGVGDSITLGDGSKDGSGYLGPLEEQLDRHFGRALTVNRGVEATDTAEGQKMIRDQLRAERPAYTLIHYGTNDWHSCAGDVPCYTIDNLRRMLVAVKGAHSLPCLATIIPANPEQNPHGRNVWVGNIDKLIRELAADEGALLVDLEAAFLREADLAALYSDHVHPNDRGYRVMADEFFRAITRPRGGLD